MEKNKMIAIIVVAIAVIAAIAAAVLLTSGNKDNGGDDGGDVKATGVVLNKTSLSLQTGGTATLTATVSPSNATNKNVTWSSDKIGVATVSNGKVTAVSAGTATITVKTVDGGYNANCVVTVSDVPVVSTDYGGTLLVYGNANMDSVIDSNDITYVQRVIANTLPKTDYCDANNDGKVDAKDVSYIQDLIAYKDGTVAYYTDGNGAVSHATLPVKKIVAYGSSSAQLFCLALGLDSNTVIQYDTWPSTTPEGVDLVFQNFAGAGTVTSGSLDNFSDVVKDGLPDAVVISYQYASDPTVLAP
ncbi:MAG: Ig-like domain-containing protein, partial [Candidatus Methanomethylophilaceae archaeon]|nr:Ig-like domain-containing protein [Candidatus Methanomethylophilaceae archaeon]